MGEPLNSIKSSGYADPCLAEHNHTGECLVKECKSRVA
jgi:hypothetical protein